MLAAAGVSRVRHFFIGSDVSFAGEPAHHDENVAIDIDSDGVVTIYMGRIVPDLLDAEGKPVRIRKVKVVR